jgi:signal transduction histidine kinase
VSTTPTLTPAEQLLSRLLSLAVHELRTPVTVVAGYLRMLLREQGGPLSDQQRKMIEEADRSCARIGAIVSEMSDLGKLESSEFALGRQNFDFAALVAEVASDMHDGDDRGVRLESRGTDQPMMVTGDRVRLASAVRALMQAAIRERGEPGVIVAECSTIADSNPPWAVLAVGAEPLLASLAEEARGNPPSFDEWRGGLGLALPVGRRVIEAFGGSVWSASGNHSRAASALRLPLHS